MKTCKDGYNKMEIILGKKKKIKQIDITETWSYLYCWLIFLSQLSPVDH